jgi:hypothetical protein
MIEQLHDYIPFLIVSGNFAIPVELLLSARWSSCYFTAGIPIYQRIMTAQPGIVRMPTAGEVEAALPDRGRSAPMLVRRIGANRFAFREKLFHFGIAYSPLMHGCITCNPATGEIMVRGYLNWYIILLSCYLLLFSLLSPFDPADIIIPACLLVVLYYIYCLQKGRFREVGDVLQRLWREGE